MISAIGLLIAVTVPHEYENCYTNCTTNSYRLVRRAKIILEAANGVNHTIIAHKYDLSRCQIRYWRKKWQENYSLLIEAEAEKLDDQKIKSIIETIS